MDLEIIGKFIKEQRKAKGMTQNELATKLSVSEKTISKWECGNGFPNITLMLPLCKELNMSANELLSGKKLLPNDYQSQAEQNLLELKFKQEQSSKFLLTTECVLGAVSSITFVILIFVVCFCGLATGWKIGLAVFGFLQFVISCGFCLKIEKDAGFYECKHCHDKHIPTFNQVLWSMHFGRTRFMKCPKCEKRSWQKKVIK